MFVTRLNKTWALFLYSLLLFEFGSVGAGLAFPWLGSELKYLRSVWNSHQHTHTHTLETHKCKPTTCEDDAAYKSCLSISNRHPNATCRVQKPHRHFFLLIQWFLCVLVFCSPFTFTYNEQWFGVVFYEPRSIYTYLSLCCVHIVVLTSNIDAILPTNKTVYLKWILLSKILQKKKKSKQKNALDLVGSFVYSLIEIM